MDSINADSIVDHIEDVFKRRGAESYLGEQVTMAQHMLQTAQCAEQAGADDNQIVAALLHDIGHYKNEIPELASPRNELLAIILLAESEDYPTLDVIWQENKEAIYLSNYSFILEEIERYLYANKKLTFVKPKYK